MRELEEKRVIVLPVIIEDCEIPLFLKDKLYADLRKDFDSGIKSIMDAVARVINPNQSRFTNKDDYTDWAIDWGDSNGLFHLRFTIVNSFIKLKITLLTEVTVICNEVLTARQQQFIDSGLDWIGRMIIAEALFEFGNKEDLRVILDSTFPQHINATIADSKRGAEYSVIASCRKLGEDNGKDQLVNISDYLKLIREYMCEVSRKTTPEEQQRLMEILNSPFGT